MVEAERASALKSACDLMIGEALLAQKNFAQAEAKLRAALPFYEKQFPDHYQQFKAKSALGAALAGEKKYAEAEPLLVSGYEGLRAQQANIPKNDKLMLTDSLERLVQLYDAWGKKAEAAKWRTQLDKTKAAAKPQ